MKYIKILKILLWVLMLLIVLIALGMTIRAQLLQRAALKSATENPLPASQE